MSDFNLMDFWSKLTLWALLWYCFLLSVAGTILSPTAFLTDEQRSRIKLVASTSLSSDDEFSFRSIKIICFQSYNKKNVIANKKHVSIIFCTLTCPTPQSPLPLPLPPTPTQKKKKRTRSKKTHFHRIHVLPDIIYHIFTENLICRKFRQYLQHSLQINLTRVTAVTCK